MMIEFKCSECGKNFRVKDDAAGKRGKCPQCGTVLHVPATESGISFEEPQPVPVVPPPVQPSPAAPQPANVTVNVKAPKATSGFGIVALVLGILACLTCWIPFIGMFIIPISVLGILFGVVGFLVSAVGRRSGIGMPVAGTIICIVAIVIAIAATVGTTEAMREADSKARATNQEAVLSPETDTQPSHTVTTKRIPKKPKEETEQSTVTPIPDDVTYTIIDKHTIPGIKRSLDIRLNRKVSKDVLKAIAMELKNVDSNSYDRTFICYLLPGMIKNAGAWATTHFNPNLDVLILGLTIEEEETLLKQQPDDPSREVIGSWFNEILQRRTTIFRQNNKLFIEHTYTDGSSGREEIIEELSNKGRTFRTKKENDFGDFNLIDAEGNLQQWDKEGFISTITKIN